MHLNGKRTFFLLAEVYGNNINNGIKVQGRPRGPSYSQVNKIELNLYDKYRLIGKGSFSCFVTFLTFH